MKNTKRNLVTSLITLLICFTMLVGTTFAWFTDTVSNTGNKIKAGTLDISLWKYDGGEFKDISDDENPIFSYDKWEPGYSSWALLKIQNDGNLSFKFKAIIKPIGELTVNAEGNTLADAIDVYSKVVDDTFEMPTSFDDVKSGEGWTVTNLKDVISDNDGIAYGVLLAKDDDATPDPSKLEAKGSVPMAIVLHMKEEAGNEYQGMSIGNSFDIQVSATQYNHEEDEFGDSNYDQYEKPACFAKGTVITMANGEKKLVENLKSGDEVVTFNHEEGVKSSSKITDFYHYDDKKGNAFVLHFSHDIDVIVVGGHCFFEKEQNKYVKIKKDNAVNYINHQFYNVDESIWETLESVEFLNDKVDTYIVVTEYDLNCSANGMLSVEDGIYYIFSNIFEYDNNLMFDKVKKEADLAKWGLWSYENAKYVNKYAYDVLNLKYLNVALGKGLISKENLEEVGLVTVEFGGDFIK